MEQTYIYPIVIYEETCADAPLWIGNFPGLNGCWVEGASRENVLEKAPGVLCEYVSACIATEWPLPQAPDADELRKAGAGAVELVEAAIKTVI